MPGNVQLDLLLIHPQSRNEIYQGLGSAMAAIEPPVWAGLIAAFVRNRGFSVDIIDADAGELTPVETAQQVIDTDPVLTAIVVYGNQPSASTQNIPAAAAVCEAIKQLRPSSKVLLVGGHVAATPESTLREHNADFVCGGEGPYTVAALIEAIKGGRLEDLQKVPDLLYWDGNHIRTNPSGPLVNDLNNEMPLTAWDLLPMDRYRAHNWHCFGDLERQPYASFYTTLGCPYHCTFCCIQAPFKQGEKVMGFDTGVNTYRRWSPQSVGAQLDILVNDYGVRNIKITDEMFVLNRSHVEGICDFIIERGYKLNIWAYARVDTVRDGMLEKLKRAGFNWLAFGIEAGSEEVRKDIQKDFGQELAFKTIESVRAAGINVIGNFIFGLPEDTQETMQATLDMALDLNCEFVNLYCAMAYPGSQLYTMATKEGWPLPEKWTGYSQHSVDTQPLPSKWLTSAQVLQFRDHAFDTYFSSPRYLEMINQKFGPETMEHIKQMASHKLIRNLV
jgi:anaerobic magnesium-protoporphyrin IX monomethyl ester cyclase